MSFQPGIVTLLKEHGDWLAGKRIGLVSHAAAVDRRGRSSADLLARARGTKLACLFGPEHGFMIKAGAGVRCRSERGSRWSVPIFSLYGETRKPTPAMLRHIDAVVFDIQNLPVRCYTYVSTLKLVLEAAAEQGREVIVADRPVPLPCVTDGPITGRGFESFVAAVGTPMCYGMTPGEIALWLRARLRLEVNLKVARMNGYRRQVRPGRDWPGWVAPSPAITSWNSGMTYPATVFTEAFPQLDHGACSPLSFQVIGGPFVKTPELRDRLSAANVPGAEFHTCAYTPGAGPFKGKRIPGVRVAVRDPDLFRPTLAAVAAVSCLQAMLSKDALWHGPGARPDFFDKLLGTDKVRLALLDGEAPRSIAARWQRGLRAFQESRGACLLYRARHDDGGQRAR